IALTLSPRAIWTSKRKPEARFTTRFIGENGRLMNEVYGLSPRYTLQGNERYVRASIVDSDGRRAWTQPVFVSPAPSLAWHDVTQWGVEGRALGQLEHERWFDRLPKIADGKVTPQVWELSHDSSGMMVRFKTDA